MSSFWLNFHHWLHWKLSKWQLPVPQPAMKTKSKWWYFRFSEGPCYNGTLLYYIAFSGTTIDILCVSYLFQIEGHPHLRTAENTWSSPRPQQTQVGCVCCLLQQGICSVQPGPGGFVRPVPGPLQFGEIQRHHHGSHGHPSGRSGCGEVCRPADPHNWHSTRAYTHRWVISYSVIQSFDRSIDTDRSLDLSINQPVSQSVNQTTNKARSVMAEDAPFSPPAWERATEHRTAPTSGGPYVFATQSWSRVHIVNCDYQPSVLLISCNPDAIIKSL